MIKESIKSAEKSSRGAERGEIPVPLPRMLATCAKGHGKTTPDFLEST
jgi:hypothetical protein